jgi:hypothetical protein
MGLVLRQFEGRKRREVKLWGLPTHVTKSLSLHNVKYIVLATGVFAFSSTFRW